MSNSAEVAIAGASTSTAPSLSEAQVSAFWAGIVANIDAARRMARQFVSRQNVEDVVNSAAVLFIESFERPNKPAPFPATDDEFRGRFLAIVRNHAIDCVRDSDGLESPHFNWGIVREPVVGGRKVADRELDRVFARNDQGKYDAPAPTQRRDKDDLDALHQILQNHLEDLSQMQYEIIVETFFEKRKRAEIAARHGISVSTYDNHLQAAFRSLRGSLKGVVDIARGMDISPWYDLVDELLERHVAAQRHRVSRKKGERSNCEGERSTATRERGKNSRAGAA